MRQPKLLHWNAALRLVRYIKRSPGQGMLLKRGVDIVKLAAFYDLDLAACPNTMRSLTGYAIKSGESLIS